MNINLDFDTDDKIQWKPHVWKKLFRDPMEQRYYDCSVYISIMWLWMDLDMTIRYKGKDK